jgi:flagellar hook-length control protein FliK
MSTVLPALIPLPGQQPVSTGNSTGSQGGSNALFSGTSIDFKTKFAAAIASLSSGGSPNTTVTSTTATSTDATSKLDALQTMLQKKIAALLAQGNSLSEIVQQLAATLANQFAGQFAGDPAQLRAQLQSAFATALSPPGGTGPPSIADSASALAQRFRQVAEAAAGVSGETGQSNRLFAGSNSDAATTAGAAPAPQPGTSTTGLTNADSILSGALAASANLTLSPGDGKTVAFNGPALGVNGDTPIGRILARALVALQSNASAAFAPATPVTGTTTLALSTAGVSPLTPAASVASAFLAATSDSGQVATVATTSASTLSPALSAFLTSFSNALAVGDGAPASNAIAKAGDDTDGSASLLATTVDSSNAPTVAAFVPVQPPFSLDGTNANAPQAANPATHASTVDPNAIVDQVLQGAFLRTDGTTSQVRLSLVPASLGDVSVKLTVNGGNVDAHIVAQSAAAHDALVAGQAQLSRSLADAGLRLTSFNVSLAGGFSSFQQQQQSSSQSQSSGRRLMIGGVDTAEDDESTLLAMPSFGPPLLANQDFGSLNYLV